MSDTPGRATPGLRTSLLFQVLTLVLVGLVAVLAICLVIVFSLPPPPPNIYRSAEVASALQGQPTATHDGAPLGLRIADRAPPPYYISRYTTVVTNDIAQRLGVAPDQVVFSSEPLRFKAFKPPTPKVPLDIRTERLLIAPFEVAVHRPDGRWTIASPREPFPNVWQQRIVLWFVLSAAALAPLAYLFARRLAAPIEVFAAAAERLGRDPGAPPLRLSGPAEVQQAVSAFNVMQERLRRYVDDRTAMVGAVAHDLRTPLTRLRFRVEAAPDGLREKMVADMDQMDAMIASALQFVRDATQPFDRRRLELCSLVETLAVEMSETGLDVTAERAAPVVIEGDPIALRRLVANLLDNAVKFGSMARVRVYQQDQLAVIEVDDNGPGVPEAERDQVFEPFHRGEPSRSRQTGGAGLGLAVVRSVARAHGGDAFLENKPGGGLRASVHLPV